MTVNMFDVFLVDLSETEAVNVQKGIRPCVIVQNDMGNKFSPTVIVIPITKEIKKLEQPTHYLIHRSRENGLKHNSMVLGEQVRVVDKIRLVEKMGRIDNVKEQNGILNAYLANITGKKRYDSIWTKVVDMFLKLIREGNVTNAAYR